MESPCLNCNLRKLDKDNPTCRGCDDRLKYVKSIGGMTHSVPIEQTTITRRRGTGREYSKEDLAFIRANYNTMTYREIGEKLGGRSAGSIGVIAQRLGLKKRKPTQIGNSIKNPEPLGLGSPGDDTDIMVLDFSDHGDLYGDLRALAADEFRTTENQIMYLIKRAVGGAD